MSVLLFCLSALAAAPSSLDIATIALIGQGTIPADARPDDIRDALEEALANDIVLPIEEFDAYNPWPGPDPEWPDATGWYPGNEKSWPDPSEWWVDPNNAWPDPSEWWPDANEWQPYREAVERALIEHGAVVAFAGGRGLTIDGYGTLATTERWIAAHENEGPVISLELHDSPRGFVDPLIALDLPEGFVDPLIAVTAPGGMNAFGPALFDMTAFVDPLIAITGPEGVELAASGTSSAPAISVDASRLELAAPVLSILLIEGFRGTAPAACINGEVWSVDMLLEDESGLVRVYE